MSSIIDEYFSSNILFINNTNSYDRNIDLLFENTINKFNKLSIDNTEDDNSVIKNNNQFEYEFELSFLNKDEDLYKIVANSNSLFNEDDEIEYPLFFDFVKDKNGNLISFQDRLNKCFSYFKECDNYEKIINKFYELNINSNLIEDSCDLISCFIEMRDIKNEELLINKFNLNSDFNLDKIIIIPYMKNKNLLFSLFFVSHNKIKQYTLLKINNDLSPYTSYIYEYIRENYDQSDVIFDKYQLLDLLYNKDIKFNFYLNEKLFLNKISSSL